MRSTLSSLALVGGLSLLGSGCGGHYEPPAVMPRVTVRPSSSAHFMPNESWVEGAYFGEFGTFFEDVTGDGSADAVVVNASGISVRPSDRYNFLSSETWTQEEFRGSRGTFFADVTGDRRADAIAVTDTGVFVRPSDGHGFLKSETWTEIAYYGDVSTAFADVTGDGLADAIVVSNGALGRGITVRRSDGRRFLANESWTREAFVGTRGTFFADVTGDGRADAIAVSDGGILVRPSNGRGFGPAEDWTQGGYTGNQGIYFADVTGDGRADAIVNNDNARDRGITVRRSDGYGFLANETWTDGIYYGNKGTWFADVTGDGRADAIVVNAP